MIHSLAFGARVLYSKFSIENLENRQVIRYDISSLKAKVGAVHTIKLSREDIIAFALLTGSDMLGLGIPSLGGKKAIQFIHVCRSLKQKPVGRTCLDELLAWGDIVAKSETDNGIIAGDVCIPCDDDGPLTIRSTCCSTCLHGGNKLKHEKHGCVECGTAPGEGCIIVTPKEKFVRSLKEKALALRPNFAPRDIVQEYFSPNGGTIPSSICSKKSLYAFAPNALGLFNSSTLILKGKTLQTSHIYVHETLPPLLARLEVWNKDERNKYVATRQKYKPIPVKIERGLVKQSWQCYEVNWSIQTSPTSEGNTEIQFTTIEFQDLINRKFPSLVKEFCTEERRKKQSQNEAERRKNFTGENRQGVKRRHPQHRDLLKKRQPGHRSKRDRSFHASKARKLNTLPSQPPSEVSTDIVMLMENLPGTNDPVGSTSDANESDDGLDQYEFEDEDEDDQYFYSYPNDNGVDTLSGSTDPRSFNRATHEDECVDYYHCYRDSGNLSKIPDDGLDRYGHQEVERDDQRLHLFPCDAQAGYIGDRDWCAKRDCSDGTDHEGEICYGDHHCRGTSNGGLPLYKEDDENDQYAYSFPCDHHVDSISGRRLCTTMAANKDESHEARSNYEEKSSRKISSDRMPMLSSNNQERIFCDMGISIEITPIVPRRF